MALVAAAGLALTTEFEYVVRKVTPTVDYIFMKLAITSVMLWVASIVLEENALDFTLGLLSSK